MGRVIMTHAEVKNEVDDLFRSEYGKIVSFLTSKFGVDFFDYAHDITQETMVAAFQDWAEKGVPDNPNGWLFTVARNKAINFLKKEKRNVELKAYHQEGGYEIGEEIYLNKEISDSMLKMIFACCSEFISIESQIILILSTLGGFTRKEIAAALVAEEEMVKKRLYRAKKKMRENVSSLELPPFEKLEDRLHGVSNSLYLLFNEGYNSSSTDDLIRKDICLEAIRLTQLLTEFYSDKHRIRALLALMCFHVARFESRIDNHGAIVLFKDQDRKLWNKELIHRGISELAMASEGSDLSSYHLEAGIAMHHCMASDYDSTDWRRIQTLYEELYAYKPSPIIKLNLAIVEGIVEGPKHAIAILEQLKEDNKRLSKYYLLYASLGEFYARLGQENKARINFIKAKELTSNSKEKELLNKKMSSK